MTATFLLPFAMGACQSLGGNIITDAFGIVSMVGFTWLWYCSNEIMDYLGLDSIEKAVAISVVEEETWINIKKQLQRKLRIDAPGGGIAFTIPLSSVGGRKTLEFLLEKTDYQKQEESTLKNAIMKAIMEKAGLNSKAKAICCSLPVSDTAGLRLLED